MKIGRYALAYVAGLAVWAVLIVIFLPAVVFIIRIWWALTKLAWEVVL